MAKFKLRSNSTGKIVHTSKKLKILTIMSLLNSIGFIVVMLKLYNII